MSGISGGHPGVLLALLLFLLPGACRADGGEGPAPDVSGGGLPEARLAVAREDRALLELTVRIAETPDARAAGLMHVEGLPDGEGMVFLFDTPTASAFWMKDTLIPLDIAFWNADGRILAILQMEPCRADPCPLYSPGVTYVGALEVNRGLLARHGVAPGDLITLRR